MKHQWFPVFQHIAGKGVLVVGGGRIALGRIHKLLCFDCRIHIIAEEVHTELEGIIAKNSGVITVERRSFREGDCAESVERPFFVVAATDSRAVNHEIALECAAYNIPVSVVDCKEEATFYFPAIVIDGEIVAGITSGGIDHRAVREAAKKIREALEGRE